MVMMKGGFVLEEEGVACVTLFRVCIGDGVKGHAGAKCPGKGSGPRLLVVY